jgi:hypothetical protein
MDHHIFCLDFTNLYKMTMWRLLMNFVVVHANLYVNYYCDSENIRARQNDSDYVCISDQQPAAASISELQYSQKRRGGHLWSSPHI